MGISAQLGLISVAWLTEVMRARLRRRGPGSDPVTGRPTQAPVPPSWPGAESLDDDVASDLLAMWRGARDEMTELYRIWCTSCTSQSYVSFVAARDRADAAQDTLATQAAGCRS